MDAPQFAVSLAFKVRSCMQIEDVVTDEHVALFPNMVVRNPSVVEHRVNSLKELSTSVLVVVLKSDEYTVILGFCSWPRLVVSKTGFSCCGMGNYEFTPYHVWVVESYRLDGARLSGKCVDVEEVGHVLEEHCGAGEDCKSRVPGG